MYRRLTVSKQLLLTSLQDATFFKVNNRETMVSQKSSLLFKIIGLQIEIDYRNNIDPVLRISLIEDLVFSYLSLLNWHRKFTNKFSANPLFAG